MVFQKIMVRTFSLIKLPACSINTIFIISHILLYICKKITTNGIPFRRAKQIDEWGPEKILQVYDPDTGMKGSFGN
jgi:hypothetical protein